MAVVLFMSHEDFFFLPSSHSHNELWWTMLVLCTQTKKKQFTHSPWETQGKSPCSIPCCAWSRQRWNITEFRRYKDTGYAFNLLLYIIKCLLLCLYQRCWPLPLGDGGVCSGKGSSAETFGVGLPSGTGTSEALACSQPCLQADCLGPFSQINRFGQAGVSGSGEMADRGHRQPVSLQGLLNQAHPSAGL